LANFVGGFVGVFVDFDFDEFGSAGFEDAAIGEKGGASGSGEGRSDSQQKEKTASEKGSPKELVQIEERFLTSRTPFGMT